MTRPKKTPRQLAEEHWNFLEGIILTEMRLTMRVGIDMFVHGYKHRDKEIRNGLRTKPSKKPKGLDSSPR